MEDILARIIAVFLLVLFGFGFLGFISQTIENIKDSITDTTLDEDEKRSERIERKIAKEERKLERMWRKAKDEVDREVDPYNY